MRYIWVFSILLIVIGCSHVKTPPTSGDSKPDSLIPQEEMIRIITDVHLTEAALIYLRNHGKNNKDLAPDYYNVLFSKYRMSKKRFSENLEYYQQDQENFIKMYEAVLNKLTSPSPKAKKKPEE
jgi:hypothetical protein